MHISSPTITRPIDCLKFVRVVAFFVEIYYIMFSKYIRIIAYTYKIPPYTSCNYQLLGPFHKCYSRCRDILLLDMCCAAPTGQEFIIIIRVYLIRSYTYV